MLPSIHDKSRAQEPRRKSNSWMQEASVDANASKQVYARVLYDYDGDTPDELDLQAGEIAKVLSKKKNGWLKVEFQGQIGLFPTSYVELFVKDKAKKSTPRHAEILDDLTPRVSPRRSKTQRGKEYDDEELEGKGEASPRRSRKSPRGKMRTKSSARKEEEEDAVERPRRSPTTRMDGAEDDDMSPKRERRSKKTSKSPRRRHLISKDDEDDIDTKEHRSKHSPRRRSDRSHEYSDEEEEVEKHSKKSPRRRRTHERKQSDYEDEESPRKQDKDSDEESETARQRRRKEKRRSERRKEKQEMEDIGDYADATSSPRRGHRETKVNEEATPPRETYGHDDDLRDERKEKRKSRRRKESERRDYADRQTEYSSRSSEKEDTTYSSVRREDTETSNDSHVKEAVAKPPKLEKQESSAEVITIQKAFRGAIARKKTCAMRRTLAKESGVLVSCKGTIQGREGWYEHEGGHVYYFLVDDDESWELVYGPLPIDDYHKLVNEVKQSSGLIALKGTATGGTGLYMNSKLKVVSMIAADP